MNILFNKQNLGLILNKIVQYLYKYVNSEGV